MTRWVKLTLVDPYSLVGCPRFRALVDRIFTVPPQWFTGRTPRLRDEALHDDVRDFLRQDGFGELLATLTQHGIPHVLMIKEPMVMLAQMIIGSQPTAEISAYLKVPDITTIVFLKLRFADQFQFEEVSREAILRL